MSSLFQLLQLACSSRIAQSALRVSIVVGTALNLINQGDVIWAENPIDWFRLFLNYLTPYCVASYSAAKNEITRRNNE
jgi:hypothetical protein